ncbi:TetR family transcriptional regulator [Allosaccharopolyspora coralli]|uniref:TetR family transcriptional regulator n=1 Tax=Allosaccharopolyspora coralli TaxID=2665642 RepID=A0A5Q3QIR5_9PSEU|nr:TetR/AcrR family transcriptional regulator [Allosaccharopolyspora coralli]QGK71349.1 TetR family transcriptional regulator [Allosaccharopolyspora coralli]
MVSQRRNHEGEARAANAIPEERILDAAYELLLAVGMSRLNMADIARRADVSRATLYRRWPNVRAVAAALVTREFATLTDDVVERVGTGREAVVGTTVRVVGAVRTHPLFRKIIDVDPDFLLPYLFQRQGTSAVAQLDLVEEGIRAGQADGSIRDADAGMLARAVMLTARSFALSGRVFVTETDIPALDTELSELIDRYLAS